MPIPKQVLAPIDGNRKLLRDEAYEKILNAITDGKLSPGEKLHDETLQEWLGISRTPIRQAVARLVDIGVIEMSPNRYTRVALIDSKKFQEGIEVTLALMKRTIYNVVPELNSAEIEQYTDLVNSFKNFSQEELDDEQSLKTIRELTEFFNEHNKNRKLAEVLNEVRAKFSIPKIISSHLDKEKLSNTANSLLEGCKTKNPETVYNTIESIYNYVLHKFMDSFENLPQKI